MKSRPITDLPDSTQFYLNLRALGFTWYDSLNLPDSDTTDYFVRAIFRLSPSNNKRGAIFIPTLDSSPAFNSVGNDFLFLHAKTRIPPPNAVILDSESLTLYPQILRLYTPKTSDTLQTFDPAIAGTPAEKRGIYSSRKPVLKSTSYNKPPIDLPQSRNTPPTVPIPSAPLLEPINLVQSSDTPSPVAPRPVVRRSPRFS
jgi:hypothetical protein